MSEGVVLGYFISADGIQVYPSKIRVIENIPTPRTWKEVCSFLGNAGYYRRFIEKFSKLASPLFSLLMKDVQFIWNEACQTVFVKLKEKLSTTPILGGGDWALPFHISSNSSDTTIGAVLGQQAVQAPYAVYYISKNLAPTKLNYTITEKDFLAIVYSIQKFRHYITGYTTFVHTENSAIKYRMNKLVTNARITRWQLLLQEFGITIIDRPGKENVVADFLSCFTNSDDNLPV